MNIPEELCYSKTHEWVRFEGDEAVIGITEYAAEELGDLVFVGLAEEGDEVTADQSFTDVESVKAVAEVNSPVSGTIKAVNAELEDAPERINEAPYEAWFIKVGDITGKSELMSAEEYEAYLKTL
ncbi:MAG: glycine cleavage system protein GcvH [Lachnospiraceae bacterium]|nr:glycine cleavage system protein GcvH [Lachnospiraceae bacterium]